MYPTDETMYGGLRQTIEDHLDDPGVLEREVFAPMLARQSELEQALCQARRTARVLAHAYDNDADPPKWALELARGWDAHGEPW